jgi:hypothetical protein
MRMTASWSGSNDPTAYKSVARRCAPMASSPRILNRQAGTVQTPSYAKSPCRSSSSLRVLRPQGTETQAPLGGKPPSSAKRFGPLTPSARSANLIAGDGTKNGIPAPNKEPATNQKQLLDRKSPIQVRIRLSPNFRSLARCRDRTSGGAGNAAAESRSAVATGAAQRCLRTGNLMDHPAQEEETRQRAVQPPASLLRT